MSEYPSFPWTPEKIKKFWDYQSLHGTEHYFGKMASGALLRKVGTYLRGNPTLLDYGCGPGFLLDDLLKRKKHVFGYDPSPSSIAVAQKRLGHHPCLLGLSAQAIPVQSFDVIFALELIEHLYDDDLNALLLTFQKLLAPEGVLILTTPYNEKLSSNQTYCPNCDHVFHNMQHVRSWSETTLASYVEQRGFAVKELIRTDLTACYSRRPWVRIRYWRGKVKPTNMICVCELKKPSKA